MSKLSLSLICLLLYLPCAVFAQETRGDIDSLFDEPAEDMAAEEPETELDYTRELVFSEKPSFSGRFVSTAGVGIGWQDFPAPNALGENLDASYLAEATTSLIFDARPDPVFRLHGKLTVTLNPSSGSYLWSAIKAEELFCDYSVKDAAFVRFGVQTIKWGQGRLYTPGDLMDDSSVGISLKISFPSVLSGLTLVTLAQKGFFINPASPSLREFAYGSLLSQTFGRFSASFGFRYRGEGNNPEGLRVLGSFKTVIVGTDLLGDVVYRLDDAGDGETTTLAGFYRDWAKFRLYGEYKTVFGTEEVAHSVGAAVLWKKAWGGPFDLGVKWLHSFDPDSGAGAPGLSWKPFTYVTTNILVPVVYGFPGSFDILDEDMPLTQRLSLVFLVKINAPLFK